MDVWVSIINAETSDAAPIGVFRDKELAITTAERASPEAGDVDRFVLDEVPDWIDDVERGDSA